MPRKCLCKSNVLSRFWQQPSSHQEFQPFAHSLISPVGVALSNQLMLKMLTIFLSDVSAKNNVHVYVEI